MNFTNILGGELNVQIVYSYKAKCADRYTAYGIKRSYKMQTGKK